MIKTIKRVMALVLALILVAGQLAIPTAADETSGNETLELPTPSGGEQTERVDVEVTIATDNDGNVSASMTTLEGGYVTESGLTVEVQGTSESDADGGLNAQMSYEGISADGHYMVQGGEEKTVKVQEEVGMTVDIIVPAEDETTATTDADGNPITITVTTADDGTKVTTTVTNYPDGTTKTEVVYGEHKSETKPTNEGDNLQSEAPANFDQTTVITDPRTVEAETKVEFVSSQTQFMDADGNPVHVETTDAYNYYYGEIYTIDNIEESVDPNYGWAVHGSAPYFYKVSTDENGEDVKTYLNHEKVCQRVVYDSKGTEDTSDDEIVNGLYCVDMSTGINTSYDYRLVNLEDAVEEGYYGEEDVEHLRAIMTYGYTWNDDENNGETNLANIKKMIQDAIVEATENADVDTVNRLANIDLDTLSRQEAAAATGMAIWHYGNRFELKEGETLVGENSNANIQALYEYLITLKKGPEEQTEIITEDKFVESMSVVVEDKKEDTRVDSNGDGIYDNSDNDDSNDVYNASVKFSMVVTPTENDDLLVHIVDAYGNVQKTVRIAGPKAEGETYDYVAPEADGSYVIGGLELQENTDNVFNISLEGTQQLAAGVYVFESEKITIRDAIEQTYATWTTEENWAGEESWARGELNKMDKSKLPENLRNIPETLTKEQYKEYLPYLYFNKTKYKNEDMTFNMDALTSSQNFIGKTDGKAEVSASMNVTFNFNMEEAKLTTIREWRHEGDPAPSNGDNGGGGFRMRFIPAGGGDETVVIEEEAVPLNADPAIEVRPAKGDTTVILDDKVPLAAAPETGDPILLWGAISLLSLGGSLFLGKKKEEM